MAALLAIIQIVQQLLPLMVKTPADKRADVLEKLLQMHKDLANAVDVDLKSGGKTDEIEKFFNRS